MYPLLLLLSINHALRRRPVGELVYPALPYVRFNQNQIYCSRPECREEAKIAKYLKKRELNDKWTEIYGYRWKSDRLARKRKLRRSKTGNTCRGWGIHAHCQGSTGVNVFWCTTCLAIETQREGRVNEFAYWPAPEGMIDGEEEE